MLIVLLCSPLCFCVATLASCLSLYLSFLFYLSTKSNQLWKGPLQVFFLLKELHPHKSLSCYWHFLYLSYFIADLEMTVDELMLCQLKINEPNWTARYCTSAECFWLPRSTGSNHFGDLGAATTLQTSFSRKKLIVKLLFWLNVPSHSPTHLQPHTQSR